MYYSKIGRFQNFCFITRNVYRSMHRPYVRGPNWPKKEQTVGHRAGRERPFGPVRTPFLAKSTQMKEAVAVVGWHIKVNPIWILNQLILFRNLARETSIVGVPIGVNHSSKFVPINGSFNGSFWPEIETKNTT